MPAEVYRWPRLKRYCCVQSVLAFDFVGRWKFTENTFRDETVAIDSRMRVALRLRAAACYVGQSSYTPLFFLRGELPLLRIGDRKR